MVSTKSARAPRRNSRITSRRLVLLGAVAGLGVAACSPGGAGYRQAAGATQMDMGGHPVTAGLPPATTATSATPPGAPAPAGAATKVSIANFAFSPSALTVKVGTKVEWTNNDIVAHTVTFTDVPNSPVLNRGAGFSRTFTAAGTYSYICSIHPFMHGTIVVTA